MEETREAEPQAEPARCIECGTWLDPGQDQQATDGGTFCRPCFNNLTAQLQQAVAEQGRDISYSLALVGGVAGGALGVLAWWGFTVLTEIAFGLVAIVIGYGVGKGITLLTGDKRHRNLQIMSVAIALVSFVYASYLVNRSFIHRAFEADGVEMTLPLVPDPALFVQVLQAGFSVMDLVFLAIVIWEAWRRPAPVGLA